MAEPNEVTMDVTPATKAWYKQKRLWSLVVLIACMIGIGLWIGRTPAQIVADLVSNNMAELYALLGLGSAAGISAYLATIRGSLGTALSAKSERPAHVTASAPVDPNAPKPKGFARVTMLIAIVGVGLVSALLGACGTFGEHRVQAEHDAEVEVWMGPPCRIIGRADGQDAMQIDAPTRCKIVTDPRPQDPPTTPEDARPQARNTMGNWALHVEGVGAFKNNEPTDADALARRTVADLQRSNQRVTVAWLTHNGERVNLLEDPGAKPAGQSQAEVANGAVSPFNPAPPIGSASDDPNGTDPSTAGTSGEPSATPDAGGETPDEAAKNGTGSGRSGRRGSVA